MYEGAFVTWLSHWKCNIIKVAGNPVTLKVDKPGIQADRFLCLATLLARNQFWESQTVHCP